LSENVVTQLLLKHIQETTH